MEKMKRRTHRGASNSLGRLWAGLLAILLVIGLVPEAVSMTVDAADSAVDNTEYTNARAREIIRERLDLSDYTHQMKRVHCWSKTSQNGYDNISGEYYSTNDGNGACTWCAVTSMLNRYLALRKKSFSSNKDASKFSFCDVATAISQTPAGNYVEYKKWDTTYKSWRYYFFVGNKPASGFEEQEKFKDEYEKRTYVNSAGDTIKLGRYCFSSSNAEKRKVELKNLLEAHPEGVAFQFGNSEGSHGIVISSYYMDGGNIKFRVIDSVDIRDETEGNDKGELPIESAYISRGYKTSSTEDIIEHITYVLYVSSYTAGDGTGTAYVSPLTISNLSVNGNSKDVVLKKGSKANLMGAVSSGAVIEALSAKIVDSSGTVVAEVKPYKPGTTYVDIAGSALNVPTEQKKDYIQFANLPVGKLKIIVSATDSLKRNTSAELDIAITTDGSSPSNNTSSGSIKISGLGIAGGNTFTKGSHDLVGTITSDAEITSVKAVVTYPSGSTKTYGPITWRQQKTANSKKVDIKTSALNSSVNGKYNMYIRFADFGVGEYKLTVTATDANNNTATEFITFRVVLGPNEIAVDWNGFKNVLEYDQGYTIPAKITAGSDIVRIEGKVVNALDSHQTTALYRKGYTNKKGVLLGGKEASAEWTGSKTEYDVAGSDIDSIAMGGLSKGYYSFVLTIILKNGTKRVFSRGFVVQ